MRKYVPLFLLLAAFIGCSSQPPSTETAANPMNDVCPIMGGEVTADGGRTEWNGKTIGFCCPQCLPKWQELSDEEKAAKLADAGSDASGEMDHSGHTHP